MKLLPLCMQRRHLVPIVALTLILAFLAIPALSYTASAATPSATCKMTTLAQAQSCAPGARIIAKGTLITASGTYLTPSHSGYAKITVKASAAIQTSSSYWCRTVNWSLNDGGAISDFLLSSFCWNNHTANSYNIHANCQVISGVPGAACNYWTSGGSCEYCSTAGAWGNYYARCTWAGQCNSAIGLWTNQYGGWWGSSWNI